MQTLVSYHMYTELKKYQKYFSLSIKSIII
jgi:hypothetical protein